MGVGYGVYEPVIGAVPGNTSISHPKYHPGTLLISSYKKVGWEVLPGTDYLLITGSF